MHSRLGICSEVGSHTQGWAYIRGWILGTHVVPGPPERLRAGFDGAQWLPRRADVPELDGGVVATGCELLGAVVAPVQVMNPGHVGRDIA